MEEMKSKVQIMKKIVKNAPILWDSTRPQYKSHFQTQAALEAILPEWQKIDSH